MFTSTVTAEDHEVVARVMPHWAQYPAFAVHEHDMPVPQGVFAAPNTPEARNLVRPPFNRAPFFG
jgi:hypothetical protein